MKDLLQIKMFASLNVTAMARSMQTQLWNIDIYLIEKH